MARPGQAPIKLSENSGIEKYIKLTGDKFEIKIS
jgi:hypothetical protein